MIQQELFILALSPGWSRFLQFFVALSILIIIHEYGHYKAARMTGTRVEKFYLFFDFLFPISTLLPFALWKKKIGDTEFGIGWFPLGGYVSIAGMVDETKDSEEVSGPPKPDEFKSKSAPARLLIMIGGILMNVLLAIVVYWFVFYKYGEDKLPLKNIKNGFAFSDNLKSAGFQDGDIITHLDNKTFTYSEELLKDFIISAPKTATVLRNGKEVKINFPDGMIAKAMAEKSFFSSRLPFIIDSVTKDTKVINGSIQKGDQVIAVNDEPTPFIDDYYAYKEKLLAPFLDSNEKATKLLAGAPTQATLTLLRNNDTIKSLLGMDSIGNFNIMMVEPKKLMPYEHVQYGAGTAIKRSITECIDFTVNQAKGLWALFTKKEIKAKNSLGGFKSFTKLFNPQFSWRDFLSMLATISILLAFMNFLPIPGLDGGYIMFLLWEMITGKKVSDKFLEKANSIGLILILALLIYANGLDFIRK